MKKILWFSNTVLGLSNIKVSGTWLFSMSRLLLSLSDIYLVNVTLNRNDKVQDITKNEVSKNFEEVLLPQWAIHSDGYPSSVNCAKIKDFLIDAAPDIIHIWGVENYFSRLIPTFELDIPLLLEIQGLHSSCADVYYGDLNFYETLQCNGLKEILFPFSKSIFASKAECYKVGLKENSSLEKYHYVSTQSQWVRDQLKGLFVGVLFNTKMALRSEFLSTRKWNLSNVAFPAFYCSASGPSPYKSIQTAVRALEIVVRFYPSTKLYIVGSFSKSNWLHRSGYLSFLYRMVKRKKLSNNIIFTGSLDASGIIEIIYKCLGYIQTSYVESYSLALAEAQAVGIPSIISYAGAMPELAENRISGLFYSPGDYKSCAARMLELIEDEDLVNTISSHSYKLAHQRNDEQQVLTTQMDIYNKVLTDYVKKDS